MLKSKISSSPYEGSDDRGRLMRRNFIRYILLSYVITLRKVSKIKKYVFAVCHCCFFRLPIYIFLYEWLTLTFLLSLQISFRVRKRFPTLDHLIELGLLRPDELKIMDILNEKAIVKKWWMPLVWATHIIEKARR